MLLIDLVDLPLVRAAHAPLLECAWELRDNLAVYDASHVALAERLDVALLTTDRRLARAQGPRCQFDVLN